MAIQIGQKASPTFLQPLELLSDCHRRVEMFLRALITVAEQGGGRELTAKQREALETALRYFREAAPKHTADEEESLFPRIREVAGEEVKVALQKIDALEADHEKAHVDHDIVEKLGQQWLVQNQLNPEQSATMLASLRRLHAIYERHIAIEDNEIFPLAGKVLSAETVREIGREMAERRGQKLVPRMDTDKHG